MKKPARWFAVTLLVTSVIFGERAAVANHGDPITVEPIPGTHEDVPVKPPSVAHTVCVVRGHLSTSSSSASAQDVTHGHYALVDTAFTCVGTKGGVYALQADGGTDGPCQLETQPVSLSPDGVCVGDPAVKHGSHELGYGWSHCGGYSGGCPTDGSNANKGDISAGGSSGWVKFVRVGGHMESWGCFTAGPLGGDCFDADITLVWDGFAAYDMSGTFVLL